MSCHVISRRQVTQVAEDKLTDRSDESKQDVKDTCNPNEDFRECSGKKNIEPSQDCCHNNDKGEEYYRIGIKAKVVGVVLG